MPKLRAQPIYRRCAENRPFAGGVAARERILVERVTVSLASPARRSDWFILERVRTGPAVPSPGSNPSQPGVQKKTPVEIAPEVTDKEIRAKSEA